MAWLYRSSILIDNAVFFTVGGGLIMILPFSKQLLPIGLALWALQVSATELVLLTWVDYLSDDVIEAFEEQTGHYIRTVIYDSDEQRDEIISSGLGEGFDLAILDSTAAKILGENSLFLPLYVSAIQSIKYIYPQWRKSCRQFGVPYFWGTVGIVYRSDKVKAPPTSWQDLMAPDPSLTGHVGMLLYAIDTLTPPLKLAGASMHTEDAGVLKQAYEQLWGQRPAVLTYQFALTYQEEHPDSDDLYMALAYSGDEYTLNGEDDEGPWHYVIPQEGTGLWVDCLSVMALSDNKALALMFIDFINQPEIAAMNANDIGSASPNQGALSLIDKELLEDSALYPDQALIDASELYQPITDNNSRRRNRIVRAVNR